MRIPKLRGFKNRFRVEYEVVNVGAIDALVARGAFEQAEAPAKKGAKRGDNAAGGQITVNQDILRAVGLVRTLNKPLKILGAGELTVPLFVVADAFTASARTKIEAAGGVVNVLEMPTAAARRPGPRARPGDRRRRSRRQGRAKAETTARPRPTETTKADKAEKPAKARKAAVAEPVADDDEVASTSPDAETAAEPEAAATADEATPAADDDVPPAEPETTEPSADLNA